MNRQWAKLLGILICTLFANGPVHGQNSPTMSVDVKVVNLQVTVRDKHGQIVRNLTKDDFALQEDDRPSGFQRKPAAVSTRFPKKQTVAQIYASIAEELRTQYSLGYTPD